MGITLKRTEQGTPGQTVKSNQLYELSEFVAAITEVPPAPLFLKGVLFGNEENWWGDQVVIDFWRGSARAAPFCTPFKRGIAIPRNRFRTSWVEIPWIKLTRDIRALDARFRTPGSSPFDQTSTQQRIANCKCWTIRT